MARFIARIVHGPYLQLCTFTAFTFGGCIYIAATKTYNVSAFWSMAVPVALMFIFLALSWMLGKMRMHDEQTGDNLYYMGFLYTLTSLGASLYNFGTGTSTDEVVRNFGVAITSTITGIALRILYNQMRRDPADIERAARHELADMTRRVRTEMENVTREFADFRRVSHQMLEEGFQEIAVQAEKNGEHIRTILDKLAMEAIKPVQETSAKLGAAMNENYEKIEGQFAEIAKKVGAAGDILDRANSSMSASTTRLGDQAENVAGKLEKVIIPDEVLKNDLAPMVKKLGEVVGLYAIKTENAAKEQNERMLAITAIVEKVADSATRAAQAAERTSEIAAGQEKRYAVMADTVEKQGKNISRVARFVARNDVRQPIPDVIAASSGAREVEETIDPGSDVVLTSDELKVEDATPKSEPPQRLTGFEHVIHPTPEPQRASRGWFR